MFLTDVLSAVLCTFDICYELCACVCYTCMGDAEAFLCKVKVLMFLLLSVARRVPIRNDFNASAWQSYFQSICTETRYIDLNQYIQSSTLFDISV